MNNDSSDILARVSRLEKNASSKQIYDDWSVTYDSHLMEEFGYISPAIAAQALADEVGVNRELEIIDFACGTGLVGVALRELGFEIIDGMDISEGMLEQARNKQVYRNLEPGDLTRSIELEDEAYDAGCCIGSMGAGHLAARHTVELIRPIKPGGVFIIIINDMDYTPGGFDQAFRQMECDDLWNIRQLRQFNYMAELVRPGWLLVAEKC
jgi:predicted TPR repeat methyltransferase